jgi:hypothetical protein
LIRFVNLNILIGVGGLGKNHHKITKHCLADTLLDKFWRLPDIAEKVGRKGSVCVKEL